MSSTIYLLLADGVVLLHFLFILFVVLGGLLVIKWRKLLWWHLAALFWGGYVEFVAHTCPLTPLEIWLRRQAGADLYQGGFISHYLVPLIYPPGLTVETQRILGGVLVAINLLVYAVVLIQALRKKAGSGDA